MRQVHIALLFVRFSSILAVTVFPSLNNLSIPITFLGEFGDGRDANLGFPRAFSFQFVGIDYTPETCFKLAEKNYYNFFGMQYAGECWATNNVTAATRYGSANKTTELLPCRNDTAVICGGPLINSVYALDNPFYSFSPSATPTVEPSSPTYTPSSMPTNEPTSIPSRLPTFMPSSTPSATPTIQPSTPTSTPTIEPSAPTYAPTFIPTAAPSISHGPTLSPAAATNSRSSSTATLNSGAAAGIAVSLFVVLCVCCPVLFLLCCGSRFAKKKDDENDSAKQRNQTAYADNDGNIERNSLGFLGPMPVSNNSGGGNTGNAANPMRDTPESSKQFISSSSRGLMEDENSSFA